MLRGCPVPVADIPLFPPVPVLTLYVLWARYIHQSTVRDRDRARSIGGEARVEPLIYDRYNTNSLIKRHPPATGCICDAVEALQTRATAQQEQGMLRRQFL